MPDTEADEPSEIGPADPFPLGEYSKGDVFALGEGRVEPARPEQELDQSLARPRAAFRRGKVEFAPDSALEGDGFEPLVPLSVLAREKSTLASRYRRVSSGAASRDVVEFEYDFRTSSITDHMSQMPSGIRTRKKVLR